jgi:hypothetical protein
MDGAQAINGAPIWQACQTPEYQVSRQLHPVVVTYFQFLALICYKSDLISDNFHEEAGS